MEIELKRNYGFTLIFKVENVTVSEDIEVREYPKDENGKNNFLLPPKRDISDDAVSQFVNVLDDIIYYREKEFNSSDLILHLFDKLPSDIQISLAKKISTDYSD